MAVIDADTWAAMAGQSVTGDDRTSIELLAEAVSDALTRRCYPILLEPLTLTLRAFDAPVSGPLVLPRPVRSITAIYLHPGAGGDSSLVSLTADLLTAGTDYYSPITDQRTGWNRSGEVWRRGVGGWGYQWRRPLGRLGFTPEEDRGAVFVTALCGPLSVPPAVQMAASAVVTLLYQRREFGAPAQSQSWNGASFSLAGPYTAEAAINTPDVTEMLRAAGVLPIHVS